jgi:hypothetical protein
MFLVFGEPEVDLAVSRGAQRQPALVEPGEERGGVGDPVGGRTVDLTIAPWSRVNDRLM